MSGVEHLCLDFPEGYLVFPAFMVGGSELGCRDFLIVKHRSDQAEYLRIPPAVASGYGVFDYPHRDMGRFPRIAYRGQWNPVLGVFNLAGAYLGQVPYVPRDGTRLSATSEHQRQEHGTVRPGSAAQRRPN